MGKIKRGQRIGILTAGGDCPGLNAAIRGVGKTAIVKYDMKLIGISDGFTGMIHKEYRELTEHDLSGILTLGGTILGTSREKPFKSSGKNKNEIKKPLVDYDANTIEGETISLKGVKVVIAEGTYTSLLKNVDTRIFITRNWLDTLEHRKKRNRGNEAGDPFIEQILATEHKIIAGQRQLADFLITNEYDVVNVN